MLDKNTLETLVQRFNESLPPGLKIFQQELDKLFKSVLQNTLTKLDLVTREDFEVQTKVLQKTRQKLEQLAEKVKKLESQLNNSPK